MDPSGNRQLNLGSILFGNGVELFKNGKTEKGKEVLRQSEEQLLKAVQGLDKAKDAILLSQAYFLLGEMYANAFLDVSKAKAYYQKSLSLFEHDGAKAALAKLQ